MTLEFGINWQIRPIIGIAVVIKARSLAIIGQYPRYL
jgi:hypothetical protein